MSVELSRRGFVTGVAALIAAPAIVRASSLMPVKAYANDLNEQAILKAMHAFAASRYAPNFLIVPPNLYNVALSLVGEDHRIQVNEHMTGGDWLVTTVVSRETLDAF